MEEGFSFRASLWGSGLFLALSVLLLIWSVVVTGYTDAPEMLDAIAYILAVGCVIVGAIMIYRMIWRPVMVRVDATGLFLKTHNATIPWEALEGVRLVEVMGGRGGRAKAIIELVAKEPLHASLRQPSFRNGKSLNQMADLPDFVVSMDGIEGSNAMLLAAMSPYLNILGSK